MKCARNGTPRIEAGKPSRADPEQRVVAQRLQRRLECLTTVTGIRDDIGDRRGLDRLRWTRPTVSPVRIPMHTAAPATGIRIRGRPIIPADQRSSAANMKPTTAREKVAKQSKPRLTWVGTRIRGLRLASLLAAIAEAKMQKLARSGGLSNPA